MISRQGSIVGNSGSIENGCIGLIRAAGIHEEKLGELSEAQDVACEGLLVLSIVIYSRYSQLFKLIF